jgi:hypothetical protein
MTPSAVKELRSQPTLQRLYLGADTGLGEIKMLGRFGEILELCSDQKDV